MDATNLSRSLFFTTQLLELGVPVVVALNKSDINEKKETEINVELLAEKLGCPVGCFRPASGYGYQLCGAGEYLCISEGQGGFLL